jgi:SWI/SNF-related matrix-associated actin-dependent regulator 1 of chromatin subfamily A
MIRRLKRDVMPELEDKSRQIQILQLEDKSLEEYLQASDDFLAWLKAISPARALRAARCEALTRIGYLMRLVARLKLPQSQRWIENFLSSHPEAKLVAFSCYHQVLDYLHEKFSSEAVLVDGRVTGLRRIESVRRFQSLPQIRLFLGNWRAAGVGVTLTAAHHVLALDLPWTPGELIQAEDRIHRIGQKRQSCIHYLIAKDTIEYRLVRVLQQKSAILSKILEGGETVSDLDIFRTLLHQMNDEYSRSIERSTD